VATLVLFTASAG